MTDIEKLKLTIKELQEDMAKLKLEFRSETLNMRLNYSEWSLRDRIGDDAVDAIIERFRDAATADPTLWDKFYRQCDPYRWIAEGRASKPAKQTLGA